MAVPAQWLKVKEIVGEALERDSQDRAAFLDEVCSHDSGLRAEAESLLAAATRADGLSNYNWAALLETNAKPPKVIGPYRLEKELGSGGMGQVWLAEQTEPVQRWIALKLIGARFYDATVVERFLAERQSLALMNHPAIAKVFDAGTTKSGQPYFAMEYVEGAAITGYCDERKLGVPERLRLFLHVCEGVRHAHQKAIIHRDLKPSNILVEEVDGKPMPRIIDFGLAKSAVPALAGETLMTQAGAFLGTPGYMSPEQADASPDIDTRTDVYSLGVLLYELLTGCLPVDVQLWKSQRFDPQIFDEVPMRPSTKVGKRKNAADFAPGLAKLLRGDLDWITLKTLDRDRDRRYGSPAELAEDIQRYLENRPVKARPASRRYRLAKYVRRNRIAVLVCAGALVLLIAFAAVQTVQLRRIQRERERADRITKFMSGLFSVSDPSEARGNSITARELLDKGSREITAGLKSDPELQADLMQVMGGVYASLGLTAQATPLIEKALAAREHILGPNDLKTLTSMDTLAGILDDTGHSQEAVNLEQEILKRFRATKGPTDTNTRKSMQNLGIYLSEAHRVPEAEKVHREFFAASSKAEGPDSKNALIGMNNLAADLIREHRYQEAQALLSGALVRERRAVGDIHPLTLFSMNNLADVFMHIGRYPEAEAMLEEIRDIQRRSLGPTHPVTAGSTYNLAIVAELQGKRDHALALLREAVEHGLSPLQAQRMKDDEDLNTMRADPRFQALMAEIEKRSVAAK